MAKPPKKANNRVEGSIDAGAHPLVASMERQHSPLDRERGALALAPDRGRGAPDRGRATPFRSNQSL